VGVSRRDHGLSLIEVVVAVALLGIAVVAILSAYATLIVSGDRVRKHGDVSTVLSAAADAVVDPARNPYVPCATPSSYVPTQGIVLPVGLPASQVAVTDVRYWNGQTFASGPCYDVSVGSLARLQQITLMVHSADNRVSEELTVLKRGT